MCVNWENTRTKSVCFHLCHSSDCVLVFTRKMGLCRAQRLESPKASRQILFLQSVMPHFASLCSSHFKLDLLSVSPAKSGLIERMGIIYSYFLFHTVMVTNCW